MCIFNMSNRFTCGHSCTSCIIIWVSFRFRLYINDFLWSLIINTSIINRISRLWTTIFINSINGFWCSIGRNINWSLLIYFLLNSLEFLKNPLSFQHFCLLVTTLIMALAIAMILKSLQTLFPQS